MTSPTLSTNSTKRPPAFWIITALNLLSVMTLLFAVMEHGFGLHWAVFDAGARLGLVLLFFLIPLGGVGIWWLHRGRTGSTPAPHRYLLASSLFLGAVWMISCFLVGLYAAWFLSTPPVSTP